MKATKTDLFYEVFAPLCQYRFIDEKPNSNISKTIEGKELFHVETWLCWLKYQSTLDDTMCSIINCPLKINSCFDKFTADKMFNQKYRGI